MKSEANAITAVGVVVVDTPARIEIAEIVAVAAVSGTRGTRNGACPTSHLQALVTRFILLLDRRDEFCLPRDKFSPSAPHGLVDGFVLCCMSYELPCDVELRHKALQFAVRRRPKVKAHLHLRRVRGENAVCALDVVQHPSRKLRELLGDEEHKRFRKARTLRERVDLELTRRFKKLHGALAPPRLYDRHTLSFPPPRGRGGII